MFAVAGANLFGQWFSDEIVIEGFRRVSKKSPKMNFDLNKAKLIQANWSYNIFEINGVFYISGFWLGKEKQFVRLPLPEDFPKDCIKMLVAGNDKYIAAIDAQKQELFIIDLQFKARPKRVFFNTEDQDENEPPVPKKYKKKNQILKVVMTNNACIFLRFVNRNVKIYANLFPVYFETDHVMGRIVDVQCGYEHYMLLTDIGKVYTWGNGRRLQLGHGNIDNVQKPTEVRAVAGIKIMKIRAGGWHSAVVSEFGDFYMWGWNDLGQLGIKIHAARSRELLEGPSTKRKKTYPIPTVVDIYDEQLNTVSLDVVDVRCGSKHTVVLLSDYSVWASGSNEYGQLGLPIKDYTHIDHYVKVYQGTSESTLRCGPWTTVIVK